MPITQAQLDLVVCPVCHAPLKLIQTLTESGIDCTGCGRLYPIVDGLPVLLATRATPRNR
jgi:uncharacterized protein YbaR (Trm112 family)